METINLKVLEANKWSMLVLFFDCHANLVWHSELTFSRKSTCADPGIFVRGGGGPGHFDKKSSDNVFFSPQLILQKSNGQFLGNLSFFMVPEGVQHFPGGPTFSRGGGGPIAYPL